MGSPLESALKNTVQSAFKNLFLDAVLYRTTAAASSATRRPFDPATPSETSYTCKAIHDEYSTFARAGGLIKAGERKVLILAGSLSVDPQPGDRIVIRGEKFTVADDGVSTDPAKAVWECKCRK